MKHITWKYRYPNAATTGSEIYSTGDFYHKA